MAKKLSDKRRESVLGRIIGEELTHGGPALDALEFVESPQGLGVTLFPVQRVLLKATFGVPMDKDERKFDVWDKWRTKILYTFTESEYLKYAHEEGRCNVGDWRDLPAHGYNEVNFIVGRRGGKSQWVSAATAYKLYLLLRHRCPQDIFHGLRPSSEIAVTFIAQDIDGSDRLYAKLREDVNGSSFFQPFIDKNTDTELAFVTEADRHKPTPTPTILVDYHPCTVNAARGPSSYVLALDEFAHFRSDKRANSDEVYAAATPSTGHFARKDSNELDSLIISITSPLKKVGKYYEIHKLAMTEGKNSHVFTLRCSTAEMNPYIPASFLRNQFKTAPITWPAEFGGEFLESSESYVKKESFKQCYEDGEEGRPLRHNTTSFRPDLVGRQYFWGFDLGMQGDGSALAIGHLEFKEGRGLELVYDYIDRMMVGEEFDGPGIIRTPGDGKYTKYTELPIEDIVQWLWTMHQVLPCYKGVTDQHGGALLTQLLVMQGITGMELIHLTSLVNSQMFMSLKMYIDNARCRFPKVPKFRTEFLAVEAEIVSKYQMRVEAPQEKGAHDDMVDAAALVAYLARKWLEEEGHLKLDPSGQSIAIQQALLNSPGFIPNLDAVSVHQLATLERQHKLMKNFGMGTSNLNPYSRQARMAGKKRR